MESEGEKGVVTHIQGQSPVNVVAFDGESENEASQNEGDDVIHVGVRHAVGGSNSEDGEEKQGTHGGHRKWHGLGDPPRKHPSNHTKHFLARGWSVKLHEEAYEKRQQRSQNDIEVLQC